MNPISENTDYNKDRLALNIFKVESEKFQTYWHYHTEIEIVLIQSGIGTRYIGDSIESFSSPELVIVGAGVPHQWVSSQESPICSSIVIHFNRDIFEQIPSCHPLLPFLDESNRGMLFEPSPHIIQLFENAADNESSLQFSFLIGMLSYLKETESQPLTSSIKSLRKKGKAQMDKTNMVIEHIMLNLERTISLDEVAEIAHIGRTSFCRWFKSETGNTFVDFLNQTRVEKAGQKLRNTDEAIAQIGYASGFESISQFNRTFKKFKGVSPSGYRTQFRLKVNFKDE